MGDVLILRVVLWRRSGNEAGNVTGQVNDKNEAITFLPDGNDDVRADAVSTTRSNGAATAR